MAATPFVLGLVVVTLSLQLATLASSANCSYDGVAALRSDAVQASFNPQWMDGLWYEHSYEDVAQAGASCQTLTSLYNNSTGQIVSQFTVKYGQTPFTIVEKYDTVEGQPKGVYRKSVDAPFGIPGGHLIGLKTAVIDAKQGTSTLQYESLILYSCVAFVQELVFFSRRPTIDESELADMIKFAASQGVDVAADSLQRVNHTGCDSHTVSEPLVLSPLLV
ncbi:unnamed protein product [Polarella glacialis]|uniref:Lipocalin/cytosolic fatty-acid binding domain-containing protein n=1 Tax=Polarella glacialis TaxID=89957 RepID=A0A813GWI3_POLGL|nr:unnamed protein product [Polarella glacialis]CAE8701109.1 unnamed protein product [Polarella glacialis]|mmetsp:Transcript_30640/g.54777  ORF Transcript_30640/g.54777 Transcript_30640/m.54777 type:complete len:220 (-) Transcript_30640:39-698(-)|eukprot:CAMPEP_0115058720 /NCGR_PEP_ID=MMETSP0227-20121206/6511_1 /TAXON_ID=89957 /ORGANISM="Polarella glacialis, Strain CCMP 1383" /LENGTH=219 /DNA_ID=CAMNT_0002443747 /DNA_START=97 /DNA_END=756 /DNA_ORIENTATION=+